MGALIVIVAMVTVAVIITTVCVVHKRKRKGEYTMCHDNI